MQPPPGGPLPPRPAGMPPRPPQGQRPAPGGGVPPRPPQGGIPSGAGNHPGPPPGAGHGRPETLPGAVYAPHSAPPPVAEPAFLPSFTPMPPKRRGMLRFTAGFLVVNAWVTLVVCVLLSLFTLVNGLGAGAAVAALGSSASPGLSTPATGLNSGLSPDGEFAGLGQVSGLPQTGGFNPLALLGGLVMPLVIGGAMLTFLTGVIMFVLFNGAAQACYALLDLEEQQQHTQNLLQMLVARQGSPR